MVVGGGGVGCGFGGRARESRGTTVMKGLARGRNYTKRSPKWYSSEEFESPEFRCVDSDVFEVGFHERRVPAARGHSLTIQVGDVGLRLISMNAGTAARGR